MKSYNQNIVYEYQAIISKLEEYQNLGKLYLDYIENTSKNELNYAKKLYMQSTPSLKQNKSENMIELMEEKMATVCKELNKQGQTESDIHRMTSERLSAIHSEFETFMKNYELEKKNIINEITTKTQEHSSLLKTVEKSKLSYKKNEEDIKQLTNEMNEAYENNPSIINKLVQKKQTLIVKQQTLKTQYQSNVEKCNQYKTKLYEKDMPTIITTTMALFEQFYRKFIKVLSKIVVGFEELSPVVAQEANLLRIYVMEMDFQSDLQEFTTKTIGKTEPIRSIELEIDENVEYVTPVEKLTAKKRSKSMKKEKKKDEQSIFKETVQEIEDVHEMMKQQEEYIESTTSQHQENEFMKKEIKIIINLNQLILLHQVLSS